MEKQKIDELAKEAKKMIINIKHAGCEGCMVQAVKALILIKNSHNADVCSRMKEYRSYHFHNKKLEEEIKKLL